MIDQGPDTFTVRHDGTCEATGKCEDCGDHYEIAGNHLTVERFVDWWNSQHKPGHVRKGDEF